MDYPLFYLVCSWDGYYPDGGLNNISLVTYDEKEAYNFRDECIELGIPSPYDGDVRYQRQFVKVYRSDDLPWSVKEVE